MLDTDFSRTVRAAQSGDEGAFARLWRDANPLLVRYLRVVGYDDPYDGACEAWITVVRGLAGFAGDERDWLVWLLSCARARAHEGSLRRAWGSVSVTPGLGLPVGAPVTAHVEEELTSAAVDDPRTRGIADSLAALRSLPLGQGEVLLLRYGAGLSVRDTSRVTGVDELAVTRLALRGLERLGVDHDLLRWSLTAPRSVAELADERVVLGAFTGRSRAGRRGGGRAGRGGGGRPDGPAGPSTHGSRVIATVAVPSAAETLRPGSRSATGRSARRSGRPRVAGGVTGVVGRSRGAAVAVAALSASVMSLGGLTAAAYVGALPAPVQQAMHDAIGAPAPTTGASGPSAHGGSTSPAGTSPGPSTGPSDPATAGLCRAWSTDQAAGTPRDRSTAFRALASRAGGAEHVQEYCAAVATRPTSQASPGPAPTTHPTGSGTGTTRAPNPHPTSPGNPQTTRTPNPHSTSPGTGTTRTRTQGPQSTAPGKAGGLSTPQTTPSGRVSTSGSGSRAPATTPSNVASPAPSSGPAKGGGSGGGSAGVPGRAG
ncbi:sigma factor-like helix-turn-helix DNA-binding protein [Pedococcus sp. NPDC057267]|uniref:sigma factor-like helix-turn-helix DNA-binding protein n=1 Tax=Pedococcus sp. NPDC057267 TaxID=3346077 RepID=UPI00362BBA6C